jgi:hypothetical protein
LWNRFLIAFNELTERAVLGSEKRCTILIIGGYGIFGGRLVDLLADEPRLTLVVSGRSIAKAQDFCAARKSATSTLVAARIDRNGNLDSAFSEMKPDILVDSTGPFQVYGDDPYRLVAACLRHRIHYLDFADGSAFAGGIAQFDAEAQAKGLAILSAVSSFPVLTAAVVRHLGAEFSQIEAIEAGIAPSPFAGVGPNVIRAIASYAGGPVELTRDGKPHTAYGLTESCSFVIAVPGRLPLYPRRFSLVDVPDLKMIPEAVPGLQSIWIGAAPVPEIFLRALNGLSWLVRWRLLGGLIRLAPLFDFVINHVRWGEHRGGMYVQAQGRAQDDSPLVRTWHLLAEGSDGPLIPSMAIATIIRKTLAGNPPMPGARVATEALELADYDDVFSSRTIHTGIREHVDEIEPLYKRVLGSAWERLPQPIRDLHSVETKKTFAGKAGVERGTGLVSRLIGALYGFPAAGSEIPVEVVIERSGVGERWQRSFAGRIFHSWQTAGQGSNEYLIDERFGPISVGLALIESDGRLEYVVRNWTFLGIPMPRFLAPGGTTWEHVRDQRFHFHVEIAHPWFGLIVRYRGWLEES